MQTEFINDAIVPTKTTAQMAQLHAEMNDLIAECGPNRHDIATVLIHVCIDNGIATRPQIIAVLKRLDFNGRHIALVLEQGSGNDPGYHRWWRDKAGNYRNLA